MGITVMELLKEPFSNRTQENKNRIVLEGKPRPLLDMSTVTMSANGEIKTAVFDPAIYDQISWLTGGETERSFYCWPCLLFAQKGELWKVTDLVFLSNGISEHEKSVGHITTVLSLKTFYSEHLEVNLDDDQWNPVLRKNKEVLKLLIDVVCTIVSGCQPFTGKNACQSQIKPEMCVKALNLLKFYNNSLFDNFEDAIKFIEMSPTILDDLVDAMTKVVKLTVMKETQMSTYAALIISDHSTNRTKSHFSVILRYIKDGKVCERFLGFISTLVSKSIDVIYNIMKSTIQAMGNADKFLAYSFDAGILTTSQLTHLNGVLQNKYPQSYFVPCYFHRLQHIFEQSLSVNTELTEFFKILNMMEVYFQNGSEQRKLLEHFIFLNTPRENCWWYPKAPFIKIVSKFRIHFIQALEFIMNNYTKWSADDYIKAHGALQFLGQFQAVFLLHILSSLYDRVILLDEALRSGSPEMELRHDTIVDIMRSIQAEKGLFSVYFNSAVQEMSYVDQRYRKEAYKLLHITIIDQLKKELQLRFMKTDEWAFCSLVNMVMDPCQVRRKEKPLTLWYWKSKLHKGLGYQFSSQLYENEITVQLSNGIFVNKNTYDLLNYFKDPELKKVFKCTNRLLEFTLTMPFRPPTQDGDLSKFKKIKRFSYPSACIKTHGDACVLHVESDILRDLQSNMFFYEDVIQKLYEVNKNLCFDGNEDLELGSTLGRARYIVEYQEIRWK